MFHVLQGEYPQFCPRAHLVEGQKVQNIQINALLLIQSPKCRKNTTKVRGNSHKTSTSFSFLTTSSIPSVPNRFTYFFLSMHGSLTQRRSLSRWSAISHPRRLKSSVFQGQSMPFYLDTEAARASICRPCFSIFSFSLQAAYLSMKLLSRKGHLCDNYASRVQINGANVGRHQIKQTALSPGFMHRPITHLCEKITTYRHKSILNIGHGS